MTDKTAHASSPTRPPSRPAAGRYTWSIFPLVVLVRAYQMTLSPFIGRQCRYEPTCSNYALDALREYGPWRGTWKAAGRILRCHPFAKGGYDPVPPRR